MDNWNNLFAVTNASSFYPDRRRLYLWDPAQNIQQFYSDMVVSLGRLRQCIATDNAGKSVCGVLDPDQDEFEVPGVLPSTIANQQRPAGGLKIETALVAQMDQCRRMGDFRLIARLAGQVLA